jgi:hypothetical protein
MKTSDKSWVGLEQDAEGRSGHKTDGYGSVFPRADDSLLEIDGRIMVPKPGHPKHQLAVWKIDNIKENLFCYETSLDDDR